MKNDKKRYKKTEGFPERRQGVCRKTGRKNIKPYFIKPNLIKPNLIKPNFIRWVEPVQPSWTFGLCILLSWEMGKIFPDPAVKALPCYLGGLRLTALISHNSRGVKRSYKPKQCWGNIIDEDTNPSDLKATTQRRRRGEPCWSVSSEACRCLRVTRGRVGAPPRYILLWCQPKHFKVYAIPCLFVNIFLSPHWHTAILLKNENSNYA